MPIRDRLLRLSGWRLALLQAGLETPEAVLTAPPELRHRYRHCFADVLRVVERRHPDVLLALFWPRPAHGVDWQAAILGDGRNRYAACRWLGIEPRTVTLPAETDWFARVVERNLNRRHANKGARAVALVRAARGKSFSSSRDLGAVAGLSHTIVRWARFLVERADDLAVLVESGGSLKAAYDLAVDAERAAWRALVETLRVAS